jgi:micrococcal nuclease
LWSSGTTDANGDTNELAPSPPAVPLQAPIGSNPSRAATCEPSYPDVCIPSPPPDRDCGETSARRFTVVPSDLPTFDGDVDGIGCERE